MYKQLYLYFFQLETSQSKINEFHSEMDATNEWMDETEKLLKSFSVGMEPEEATKLQEKTEVCFFDFDFCCHCCCCCCFCFYCSKKRYFSLSQNLLQRLLLSLVL